MRPRRICLPLFFASAAGFSELISGTMTVAADQPISRTNLSTYVAPAMLSLLFVPDIAVEKPAVPNDANSMNNGINSSFAELAVAMAPTSQLIFVLAPATQLPEGSTCLDALQKAQATGPSTGFALRIFSKGSKHSDLGLLPVDGLLIGEQRRSSDGTLLL